MLLFQSLWPVSNYKSDIHFTARRMGLGKEREKIRDKKEEVQAWEDAAKQQISEAW